MQEKLIIRSISNKALLFGVPDLYVLHHWGSFARARKKRAERIKFDSLEFVEIQILGCVSNFHPLKVVGRGSETQL